MFTRPRISWSRTVATIGTMFVLLAGCAEERPTAPSSPEPLRAMNLDDKLVLEVSEWVAADSTDSKDSFHVSFENIPMIQEGRADDIQMRFLARRCFSTFNMDLFLPDLDMWRQVEHNRWQTEVLCVCLGFCIWGYARTLSGFGCPDVPSTLGERSELALRCSDIFDLSARAIQYDPLYEFVPVGAISPYPLCAMAFDGTDLWISQWYADSAGGSIDSIFVFNLAGERMKALEFSPGRLLNLCYDTHLGQVWGLALTNPRQLVRINQQGTVEETFEITVPVKSGIEWQDDRIWFLTEELGIQLLVGVNTQASVDSGHAVIDRRYIFDQNGGDFRTIFFEDNTLYALSTFLLTRFTLMGEEIGQWPLPVWTEGGTPANGSLWLLHQGPREVKSGATILSRFRLPESSL